MTQHAPADSGLRQVVKWVALLNLDYFGIEFAVDRWPPLSSRDTALKLRPKGYRPAHVKRDHVEPSNAGSRKQFYRNTTDFNRPGLVRPIDLLKKVIRRPRHRPSNSGGSIRPSESRLPP